MGVGGWEGEEQQGGKQEAPNLGLYHTMLTLRPRGQDFSSLRQLSGISHLVDPVLTHTQDGAPKRLPEEQSKAIGGYNNIYSEKEKPKNQQETQNNAMLRAGQTIL